MSKTKHTPGPWRIELNRISSQNMPSWKDLNPKASDPPESRVPVCHFRNPYYSWWSPESIEELNRVNEANARLIAAAPEMLEALKLAYLRMEHRQGDCYSNDYMGACCCGKGVVKAAIVKAEGRD